MKTHEFHQMIKNNHPNICQMSASQNGQIIYQDNWNQFKSDDTCHIASTTKSIVSLLIGIAIDKGMIGSVDDNIIDYFPDYPTSKNAQSIQLVTIKQLLTMTAPYKCKGNPWTKICSSENWTKSSLALLGGKNTIFNYQTVCLHILTGLLHNASGMKTVDFINEFLFEPLEIDKCKPTYITDQSDFMSIIKNRNPKNHLWLCDKQNVSAAGFGLHLSANDLVKIGNLILEKGLVNGHQVVSKNWIKEMTQPFVLQPMSMSTLNYGYLCWLKQDEDVVCAIGDSGNMLYIDRTKQLVIAITAHFKPSRINPLDIVEQVIIPYLDNNVL